MLHQRTASQVATILAATALLATSLRAQITAGEYADRRAALAATVQTGSADFVVVAIGAREPREDYVAFYQAPPFLYLTGVREPDAAVVGVKSGGQISWTLFVQPRDPAREVWTGRRVGPEAALATWGLPGRPAAELSAVLDSLLATPRPLIVLADLGTAARPTADDQLVARLKAAHSGLTVTNATPAVAQLRGKKSDAELALIKRATALTVQAHRDAARAVRPNSFEYEVQADLERVFRRGGADRPSFASIVGSGPNATTLHYNANDRQMRAGEMVVIDIGASFNGYAADMTRAYPVNGTFTPAQRAIYQLVRDAQMAGERQAKPGTPMRRMNDSASAVLAAGLTRLGLIDAPDATYDCGPDGKSKCSQLSLFYMHGLSHGIGLEVHDPDQYDFGARTIQVGSVFTIEPGLYVRENLLEILPKTPRNAEWVARRGATVTRYRNIGVRIEDDYLVTPTGLDWLTKGPREAAEIEQAMKRLRM